MLDETHTAIARPATFVVVPDDVVVRRIRISGEVALDEVPSFGCSETEHDVKAIDVARVEADGMSGFGGAVSVLKEVVGVGVQTEQEVIEVK